MAVEEVSSPTSSEASSLDTRRSLSGGTQKWQKAVRTVSAGNAALSKFKTLRDMHTDCFISNEQLEPVKKLGEGAFASVDKAW